MTIGALIIAIPVSIASTAAGIVVSSAAFALGVGIAVPAAAALAILKYGLYEVDVVINKTIVYFCLAAVITGIYVGIVVGIGAIIGSKGNVGLSVLATAVVAVGFQPIRERSRRFANRLVYGKRATPYEVLSEFAGRIGDSYSLEDVLPRTARLLAEGTGADRADVWLEVGSELVEAASWPKAVEHERFPLLVPGAPEIPGASAVVEVRHRGESLGALSINKPANDPVTPAEEKLLADVASQAGLVLRNVGLIEDLRASRQRLVAAQDEERRKIERNIHDGAQQQLVALSVKLKLLGMLTKNDPEKAGTLAAQLQTEAGEALENLRDLARGIYPPLLADQGLAAALDSQARKAPIPVRVESGGLGRYPQATEAAIYFCVLEALQNVAKYANASFAIVRLAQTDGSLRFEVQDDGEGFDPDQTRYGTGLQGIEDRIDALNGTIEVRSSVGEGTIVMGALPV